MHRAIAVHWRCCHLNVIIKFSRLFMLPLNKDHRRAIVSVRIVLERECSADAGALRRTSPGQRRRRRRAAAAVADGLVIIW